jgi:hypothetical protein
VGTRLHSFSCPCLARIEFANIGKQALHRRIEVCCLLDNAITQESGVADHAVLRITSEVFGNR